MLLSSTRAPSVNHAGEGGFRREHRVDDMCISGWEVGLAWIPQVCCMFKMCARIAFALMAVAVATAAELHSSPMADFDLLPVSNQQTLRLPLSAVGQLSNGCTGYLIGPCHVMTVAHCVYEPWRRIWWQGLDFHPGRNVGAQGTGWSPLGSAAKHDVRLHPNWTSTAAAPASDAAIIITRAPIGRTVGWFRHTPPTYIKAPQPGAVQSARSLADMVSAQQLTLHIAGYPDNRANGSMWQQCCNVLDWQLQGNLMWHDCYARGGNSGSAVWVVWPQQRQQQQPPAEQPGNSSTTPPPTWDQVQVVGVHSSSLKFPKDSQVGVYATQLYQQNIIKAQQRRRTTGSQCTAMSSSLEAAPAAPSPVTAAHAAAVPPVVTRGRRLQAGAGGREDDGEHTLLPVAVPFHGDNFKWIDSVLKEFEVCPRE